jgi:hypothetical protein
MYFYKVPYSANILLRAAVLLLTDLAPRKDVDIQLDRR